jgi:hypothetical protein
MPVIPASRDHARRRRRLSEPMPMQITAPENRSAAEAVSGTAWNGATFCRFHQASSELPGRGVKSNTNSSGLPAIASSPGSEAEGEPIGPDTGTPPAPKSSSALLPSGRDVKLGSVPNHKVSRGNSMLLVEGFVPPASIQSGTVRLSGRCRRRMGTFA